ncbi:hypothetical protein [Streptomyces sp. NRRL WC-3604]|uniref:hypothetical protein n=1 Tax=Streptomyces sp. NRRL WC-3604 TaxID=1609102 RepID=UPI000A98E346|nr:hypothetical protein [Streptomyces sp. NRRL WC-3604]
MRQALTRGLIVAAAATSALSLYGTTASAAPRVQGTMVKSAVVLPGHANAPDSDGLDQLDDKLGAMDEQLDGVDEKIDALELPGAAPSGEGTASYGSDEPSGASYGEDEPAGEAGYGTDEPSGYGSDEPSGEDHGYGYGDEPSEPTGHGYGYGSGYGEESGTPDEPTGHGYGYGDEPGTPEPTPHEPGPAPSQTPPAGPDRPHLPETGAGGLVGGIAASGALLIAGTVLYRRSRSASRGQNG